MSAKPISIKSAKRKSGGCARNAVDLTLGDLPVRHGIVTESIASCSERTAEVSRGHNSCASSQGHLLGGFYKPQPVKRVMENGLVSVMQEGTPQGGPLSPLLSNIVLDELDRELERRSHRFVRYADDGNVYVGSRRAGERVMESITKFITTRLKLKVNRGKSTVGRPWEQKLWALALLRTGNLGGALRKRR